MADIKHIFEAMVLESGESIQVCKFCNVLKAYDDRDDLPCAEYVPIADKIISYSSEYPDKLDIIVNDGGTPS